jgi:methionyl-tRNA formyltransferase
VKLGLPVLQPKKARAEEFIHQIRELNPDLNVVVAYGQILPQALLDSAKFGSINVHTSILPKHRGAAPIQAAILSGDSETGVTIMKMDAGLDTGPILKIRKTAIEDTDNAQTLHDRLAKIGAELLVETIPDFVASSITPEPQPEGASYAKKIEKADGLVHWEEPARILWRKLRAFTPWPGLYTFFGTGEKRRMIKIGAVEVEESSGTPGRVLSASREGIVVAAGEGSLRILTVQPEGRKWMAVADFLAGHPLQVGQEFTR